MAATPRTVERKTVRERLAAGALEVQAGGVHEHQVKPRQQIAPMREQPLLNHVLQAARRDGVRPSCSFSGSSSPSHAIAR